MNLNEDYAKEEISSSSEDDLEELQQLIGIKRVNPTPEVALVVPESQLISSLNKVKNLL